MPVIYNGRSIIPAPLVSISKEHQTTDDGQVIGVVYTVTVQGKLSAVKGSPNSAGVFWTASGYPADETIAADSRLASILTKQDALRRLFATEGQAFEVTPWDGTSPPLKFNPRVRKPPEFPQGNWVEQCEYTIVLEADVVYLSGTPLEDTQVGLYKVSKAGEEWNVETLDETKRTYRLTHSVSATGKRFYDDADTLVKPAWENARDYVLGNIGLGLKPARMDAPGVLNLTLQAFNYLRSQHVNELGGTFGVTETWVCYDPGTNPPAYEDWSINLRTSANEAGRVSVSVEGTITGLEQRNPVTGEFLVARWVNALEYWDLVAHPNAFARAQSAAAQTLNPLVLSTTLGENQVNGTINYHFEWDNRPASLIVGSVSESVTISTHGQQDLFAKIPVPGRTIGPVLQDLQTKSEKKKTISVEVQMPPATYTTSPVEPNTDALVLLYAPVNPTKLFVEQNEPVWSPTTGRYTRTVTYTWE